jgi:hypothetical protein
MSDLGVWALQLKGVLEARGRIAEALGAEWPKFEEQLRRTLEQLATAGEDQLCPLVDQLMKLGLDSPARSIFKEIGRQSWADRDRLDEMIRSLRGEQPFTPKTRMIGLTAGELHQLSRALLDELGEGEPEGEQELPPRYSDFAFYKEDRLGDPLDEPVKRGHTLRAGQWYHFEVAIREKPLDLVPVSGERRPIREPKQKEPVTLYVAVTGDGFEVENPVQTLTLPPRGDSTKNARFRVRSAKETANVKTLAKLQVRMYYEFNLLEVANIQAEVVGKLEDDTHSQLGLEKPITFEHTQLEGEYMDFDDVLPRAMHINITREGDAYLFYFLFRNEADKKVEFTDVPARLTKADLESDLVTLREALWGIAMSGVYEKQLEGGEDDFERQMNRLARLGRRLWIKVFKRDEGSALWEIGNWLEEHPLKPDGIVQVSVQRGAETFVFPWSLVYDKKYPRDESELPSLDGFWGLRYIIEQRLPTRAREQPIRLENGFEIAFMLWPFSQVSEQKALIEDLTTQGRGTVATGRPITGADATYDLLGDCKSHIMYFFTHGHTRHREADIGGLDFIKMYGRLSPDSALREHWKELYDQVRQPDFEATSSWIGLRYGKLYLEELYDSEIKLHNNPIVFLNMCESAQATPSLSESFVHLFINRGARCVVATECTMRPLFAHHFSSEFLKALLGGDSAGQAILDARRKFIESKNPLGLAYTLFGSAGARFDEPAPLRRAVAGDVS